jgi:hypothetical protein
VHLEQNRRQPAERLAAKAVDLLRTYGRSLTFIENLNELLDGLDPLNAEPPELKYAGRRHGVRSKG